MQLHAFRGLAKLVLCVASSLIATAAEPAVPATVLGQTAFGSQLSSKLRLGLSGDGSWLAAIPARDMSLVDVYDLRDGSLAMTLRAEPTSRNGCDLRFSADGSQLFYADGESRVLGWDLRTRDRILDVECDRPGALAIAPEGTRIAVSLKLGSLQLRELPGGRLLQAIDAPIHAEWGAESLSFSKDGRFLSWNQVFASVVVQHLADGRIEKAPLPLPLTAGDVFGWTSDFTIGLRNTPDRTRLQVFRRTDAATVFEIPVFDRAHFMTFLGDTHEFAVGRECGGPRLEIWNGDTGRLSRVFEPHSEPLYDLLSSADGKTLVGHSASRVWVWDCGTGRLKDCCRGPCEVTDICFSSAGDLLAATGPSVDASDCDHDSQSYLVCPDGVHFWKYATNELVHSEPGWRCAGFSPDGRSAWLWKHDGAVRQIDTRTFATCREARVALADDESLSVVDGAGKPDPQLGVLRALELADTDDGIVTVVLRRSPGPTSRPEFWMTGNFWGRKPHLPLTPHPPGASDDGGQVMDARLVPDGSAVLVLDSWSHPIPNRISEERYSIGIYPRESKGKAIWLNADGDQFVRFAIAADGQRIAVLSIGLENKNLVWDRASLWSAADGTLLREWNLEKLGFHFEDAKIAISANGSLFAIGGEDGQVRVWNVERKAGDPIGTGTGHTGIITSLAFSPDGKWLASGGRDCTVRVFKFDSLLKNH